MKQLRFSLVVLVALIVVISCNRMEEQMHTQNKGHVFSVSAELLPIEQEPESKGYLDSYISATWNEGDNISVVNLTKGKILGGHLTADRTGSRATFSGTVTGTISSGDMITLFYPSFGNAEETDFSTRNINLAEQSKESNVPLVSYSGTFTASGNSGEFVNLNLGFYYILSYLKINMANLPADAAISKISLRNIPNQLSLSVNNTHDGFDIANDAEKSAKGVIELTGTFKTSASGSLAVAMGVMPSAKSNIRSIIVTADASGDYYSPLTSAELQSHKYYNTIASQFELISLPGKEGYGIYDLGTSTVINSYEEFANTVISGTENGESDFTMLNAQTFDFWTLKGVPSDAEEGTVFKARIYTNGVDYPTNTVLENAKITLAEADGDFTKLWIKAGNTLFIVRK